jgi:anti-sigma factor RsiW
MNCAEFESILADYVDGTLGARERAAVDLHAAECANCREFMERVEEVDAPAELITRIAYQAPRGRSHDALDVFGFWPELKAKWIDPWMQPLLQPRLAMGMAMTVLSFSMLARCTGAPVQHLQAADLNPAKVLANLEDRVLRARDRVVKNYENLRVVYEIESRLNEMQQTDQGQKQDQQGGQK